MALELNDPQSCCANISQCTLQLRYLSEQILSYGISNAEHDNLAEWLVKLSERIEWLLKISWSFDRYRVLLEMLEKNLYRDIEWLKAHQEKIEGGAQ